MKCLRNAYAISRDNPNSSKTYAVWETHFRLYIDQMMPHDASRKQSNYLKNTKRPKKRNCEPMDAKSQKHQVTVTNNGRNTNEQKGAHPRMSSRPIFSTFG